MTNFVNAQKKRQSMMDLIRAQPGIRAYEIEKTLGFAKHSINRTLQRMSEEGLLRTEGVFYYAMSDTAPMSLRAKPTGVSAEKEPEPTVRIPGASRIYRFGDHKARPSDTRCGERGRVASIMDAA